MSKKVQKTQEYVVICIDEGWSWFTTAGSPKEALDDAFESMVDNDREMNWSFIVLPTKGQTKFNVQRAKTVTITDTTKKEW